MPRTLITDDQILDQAFITEAELNEFFNTVVITGTEDTSTTTQTFDQYFPGRNLITAGSNITVITGSNFVQIASTAAASGDNKAIIGDNFITVSTGTSTVQISADAIISGNTATLSVTSGTNSVVLTAPVDKAIVGDAFISVSSGTSTIELSADAIVGGTGISVVSGTNSVTINNTSSSSVPNAIVGISNNITVISGSSTTTVSGVVTVTSGIAYINDSTRGNKALSVTRQTYTFNFQGLADNEYLRIGGTNHANTGYPIVRPATITAISLWFSAGPNNKQFEVRKNGTGTSIKTILANPNVMVINDAENIDLNKGDYIQVFVTSAGTGAQSPVFSIEIAWRLP